MPVRTPTAECRWCKALVAWNHGHWESLYGSCCYGTLSNHQVEVPDPTDLASVERFLEAATT